MLDIVEPEENGDWRTRALQNHQRDLARGTGGPGQNRFGANPRLYGHTRQNRQQTTVARNQLNNLRELRANM